jgi:hypothetical protein
MSMVLFAFVKATPRPLLPGFFDSEMRPFDLHLPNHKAGKQIERC